jgi:hypothetical protein
MVVQTGALDAFVGDDKNNVISMQWVSDNIKSIYPNGYSCTSRSAFADDDDIINIAAHQSVNIEKDTNDYYVAGDIDLSWIGWAEVAGDVVITVLTVGGGQLLMGGLKGARAAKASKNLIKTINDMKKIDKVNDYTKALRSIETTNKELGAITKVSKSKNIVADISKLEKEVDALKKNGKSVVNAQKELDELRHGKRLLDNGGDIKKYEKELETLNKAKKEADELKDVKEYNKAVDALRDLEKWRKGAQAYKIPQRGNVIARKFRSAKAMLKTVNTLNKGNKEIGKAAKIARQGMKSGKLRDWFFHTTLKAGGMLAKAERNIGILYTGVEIAKGMWDFTEVSTDEFTSNLEFKPLGLLSADDLEGHEDTINYGFFLSWWGDSTSPADDDAAYLQAMDFATKFHQDLDEVNTAKGGGCDVDIYVVRPIVQNPDSDYAQLYYLIMNDVPWTVSNQ